MRLTVLVDNNTMIDRYLIGEPALSFLIEEGGKKILFDAGYSDAFLKNADAMNISLLDVDRIVISHGHLDHTWGLVPLIKRYTEAAIKKLPCKRPMIVTHPLTFRTRKKDNLEEIGSLLSERKLAHHFDITLSREPYWISERLVFLGEVEKTNDFEAKKSMGKIDIDGSGALKDDYLTEDSALVYRSDAGLVVITGCSHAGICNILEYAGKVCPGQKIIDVIGGFHLLDTAAEMMQPTLEYLKALNPGQVHACHCTDLAAKIAMAGVVNVKEVAVGLKLEYE